jgi:hypothetical protein
MDCTRCDGTGEIVVAGYDVGDDCYNDDFDACPRCKGTGHEPEPRQETP